MCYLKPHPAELHILASVDLVPAILEWTRIDDIKWIDVETYHQAYWAVSSRASTYNPRIREEADHSYPYVLAASLMDGGKLGSASYTQDRLNDPVLHEFMKKIRMHENDEFTDQFRPRGTMMEIVGHPHTRITVENNSGDTHTVEINYGKGHSLNPMTADDINTKLDEACEGIVSHDRREEIRLAWWNLDKATTIAEPIRTLSRFR
jgi:2-methylcitrate dehydratase